MESGEEKGAAEAKTESESSLKKKIVGLEERVLRDYIWKNIVKKKKKNEIRIDKVVVSFVSTIKLVHFQLESFDSCCATYSRSLIFYSIPPVLSVFLK